jgi:SAM-dependent methyltransferase|tara:strand:- start:5471 stop:6244 length:774 start_codon:yes stop_codon:yes gene_type:complete
MEKESFDKAATRYDETFTNTNIGIAQRNAVWRHIDKNRFPQNSHVLELNCGTGEDASRWEERKMHILATDISQEMVKVSKSKFPSIDFKQLDIKNCREELRGKNIIFSNFGGFNCLSSAEIKQFFLEANQNLKADAKIILLIMGKNCIWDNLFLLAKGKFSEIGRRNTYQSISVSVENETIQTWYYSPKEIKKLAGSNFKVEKLKPIGLLVPPSYLSHWFSNKSWLISILAFKDRFLSFSFLANYADHYYIQLTKRK